MLNHKIMFYSNVSKLLKVLKGIPKSCPNHLRYLGAAYV